MIPRRWLGQGWQLKLWSLLVLVRVIGGGVTDFAFAQVTADPSVGTTVKINGATFEITGGTAVRDTNLFHSFSSFSVQSGEIADFRNASTIANILIRVTGGTPSNIQGQLWANGTANLFLMNPNGILFGPDAELSIGGSFVGTTANVIQFPGGGEFSMTSRVEPQNPLLAVNPSAFLFNQIEAQPITNQSIAGLRVPAGRSLLLVGGNVKLEGGRLRAPGGRVELGGVAGAGTVGLDIDSNNLRLSFPNNVARADVFFSNGARVNTTGIGGGNVQVTGRRVTLSQGSQIEANTRGSQPGGTLAVNASESVELIGGSRLLTDTENSGVAGALRIETQQLIVQGGAQVSASTGGKGDGGDLIINASQGVQLIGTSVNGEFSSGLFAQTHGTAEAGNIEITTGQLKVSDGARISTSTKSEGNGGSLIVNASQGVRVIGTSADGQRPSGLFAQTFSDSTGNGGSINISTNNLDLSNGAVISARSEGSGKAGGITINANQALNLNNGEISATATRSDASNITVKAPSIRLNNRAFISANTQGGQGNINLNSVDLVLHRDSNITTNAKGTNIIGGNITIDTGVLAALKNSDISANSANFRGGNVSVTAQGIFGTAFRPAPTLESDITATGANSSLSGTVTINTPDVDPSRGLTNLPTEVVDASNQIDQTCSAGGGNVAKNEFIITGRGGLPDNPSDALSSDAVWTDLRSPSTVSGSRGTGALAQRLRRRSATTPVTPQPATPNPQPPFVEANGWVINDKGEVVLIATAPTVTPHTSALTPAACSRF